MVVSELICYPNEHPEWNLKDQVQENIARLDEFETESDQTNDNLAAHIDVFEETIESQIAVQSFSNDTLDKLMAQQRDQKSALEKLKKGESMPEGTLWSVNNVPATVGFWWVSGKKKRLNQQYSSQLRAGNTTDLAF